MPAVAFVLPLLPGKTDADRSTMRSCWEGDRKDAFRASRERHGITREAVWIQETPEGDVVIVYLEADDLEAAMQGVGRSSESFDAWFREHLREVHGIRLEEGFSPPEQVLDFTS